MIRSHAEPPGESQSCGYVALLHQQHYSSGPIALGEAASARRYGPCRPKWSLRQPWLPAALWAELMLSWSYDVDRCRVMVITPQYRCCECNEGYSD